MTLRGHHQPLVLAAEFEDLVRNRGFKLVVVPLASKLAFLREGRPYRQEEFLVGLPYQVPHPYQDSSSEVLRQLAYRQREAYRRREAFRQEVAFEEAFLLEDHSSSKPSR